MTNTVFSPSFGNKPRILVGRNEEMSRFRDLLSSPSGSRDRILILLGQRGMGKTVLLLELEQLAKKRGFVTTRPVVAASGMLDKIMEQIEDNAKDILKPRKAHVSGGNIGAFGFSAGIQLRGDTEKAHTFSYHMANICREINSLGKGVLFIIDEVQSLHPDLRELVITFQELVGMGLNVAVVFAGLPRTVSALLQSNVLTFLNRAPKDYLKPLRNADVSAFFKDSFTNMGVSIEKNLCDSAAASSMGSPYMMQLIGYYLEKEVSPGGSVNKVLFEKALGFAVDDFDNDICEAILKDLSDTDINTLLAISALDSEEPSASQVIHAMGVSNAYYQQYKNRLADAGILDTSRRGHVSFAVPYIRDYIRKTYMG